MYVKLLKYAKMEADPPPDPLGDYLREWGLDMYITQFKEQAIDVETLQMLSETDIKELIPIIGHRAKLNAQIQMLRALTTSESESGGSFNMDISDQPSTSAQCGVTTYVLQPLEPTVHPVDNSLTDIIELFKILNSSNEGKALLRHKDTGLLNNAERRRLCNVIINNELKEDPKKKITSARLYELAYEIPKIFKKENSSVYFIPYMSISPKQKVSAKGKLLDCYRQRRREFIKSGIIDEYSRRQTSTNCEALPLHETGSNIKEAIDQLQATSSEDINEKLLWLNNCCYPWETVDRYWNETGKQRLTELTSTEMTVDEYLKKYKPLNQPGGVLLLLKDFKNLYPLCDDKLYENWSIIRPKILEYSLKRQDSGLKDILSLIQNYDTEEILNTVAFMALPFLMTTSMVKVKAKTKKQWRPSKHEVLESFICHLKSAAEIDETIQRRKTKLQELGLTLQPFIILVGPSLKEISGRYIILNHLRYEMANILKCVDACFKIIFVLNAEYPAESSHLWQFLQKAIFNLHTKYDKVFTTVRALVTDLGLEVE